MRKYLTLPQLKKYDVTQKVIQMLADAESRTILFSIVKKGKTALELSEKGRKFKVYKSRIKNAEITIKKPEPVLILTPNI